MLPTGSCDSKEATCKGMSLARPYCGENIVLCMRKCEKCAFVSVALRTDQSKSRVFEELPGSFLLCLPRLKGRPGVEECTDVLSESAVF